MEILDSFLSNVRENVFITFKPVYLKYISSKEEEIDYFFDSLIQEVIWEVDSLIEVTQETVYVYKKRRQTTKKRWFNKDIQEQKSFFKEIEIVAKSLYEDLLNDNPEQFHKIYGYHNYEELKAGRLIELQKWANDMEAHITNYRYLKDKTKKQILTALSNDVKHMVFSEIYRKCPKGRQGAIPSLPISISQLPIDYTNRVKINSQQIVTSGSEEYMLNKYYIDNETVLESRISVEILKSGVIGKVLKLLNKKDIDTFLHCMAVADENFFSTREIIVDIGDIVKNVYSTDGKNNYMSVKESLYKMQYLNSGVIDKSLRGFTTKIFDNVDIYSTGLNKETAKVVVNIDIVNEYVKKNTVSIYKEVIDQFKLDSSKIAIFSIQRERIKIDATTPPGQQLLFYTNINFFRGILYFSNKKKRENIKAIEKMLDEIVENRITIKKYERIGDKFTIEFYPISETEKRDLIGHQEMRILIGNNDKILEHLV